MSKNKEKKKKNISYRQECKIDRDLYVDENRRTKKNLKLNHKKNEVTI